MKRRAFIALLSGAVAFPVVARTQEPKKVVGILAAAVSPNLYVQAFLRRLGELGWSQDQNVRVEFRGHSGTDLTALAVELVRMKVDVIFATSAGPVEAARKATTTIPIVFGAIGDPVGAGYVASLPRPGGNVSGVSHLSPDIAAKGLELLKELMPSTRLIGVLFPVSPNPSALSVLVKNSIEAAAAKVAVDLHVQRVESPNEFDNALAMMRQAGVTGFVGVTFPMVYSNGAMLAELALKHRLAGIFAAKEIAHAGALMSYGADLEAVGRGAAAYVDKILRGARPADLPVEQVSRYELVINLKTAKALGLTVPATLLARADEVIE